MEIGEETQGNEVNTETSSNLSESNTQSQGITAELNSLESQLPTLEKKEMPVERAENTNANPSVKQEQIQNLLMSREIGWQEIIYDLINTEQLDPWDIDIIILSDKFLEKVEKLEEMDFFISSKVLLAAAFLLRIKSELLLNKYIKSVDEILFGKKEDKKYHMERIELEDEIPELIPKSPMPRFKKVTLKELLASLDKAIKTENRRIEKEIINKNSVRESSISLPKSKININDKIKEIYEKIFGHLNPKKSEEDKKKVSYTDLAGMSKEERIIVFLPLLHLENQKKIWLEQENHFEEIYIWLKQRYDQDFPDHHTEGLELGDGEMAENEEDGEAILEEVQEEINALEKKESLRRHNQERVDKLSKEFENPLEEMFE